MNKTSVPKIPPAAEKDYVEIQGGKPTITREGKLTVIHHDYPEGGGMIVKSHKKHGTVILQTPEGRKEFQADLLRKFHGEPCEGESQRHGGEGYDRG